MQQKIYYKQCVLSQLQVHIVGNYIAKLINEFIDNHPFHSDVLTNTIENWDLIYYSLLNAHSEKRSDLFLYVTLQEAINSLNMSP